MEELVQGITPEASVGISMVKSQYEDTDEVPMQMMCHKFHP